jgi:hypothetical protein
MSSITTQIRARGQFAATLCIAGLLAATFGSGACGPVDDRRVDEETPIEVDNALATTLTPIADTHVRDGSSANTNFGTSTTLEVKKSSSGFNREAYLRFSLSSFSGTVQSAKLRVFGQLSEAGTVPVVARLMGEDVFAFGETTTVWNTTNRQTMPLELGRAKVNSTTDAWYEIDVTSVVRQAKRSGDANIAFGLLSPVSTNALVQLNSREGVNKPQLVISTATALFVVGNATLGAGDNAVKNRLAQLGFAVTVKTAATAASTDTTGQSLVVVSSTVASADVNTKFRDVTVPVVLWENAVYDDMKMTGTVSGTDFGTTASQTAVTISTSTHALAGGKTGTVTVSGTDSATWGKPAATAVKVATLTSDSTKATVFGYEKGAAMVGMNAPARRVGLFLGDNAASTLTRAGLAMFDAAVNWASSSKPFTVKKLLVLNYDPILENYGNVRASQYFSFWPGAHKMIPQIIKDIEKTSGDYVRYQVVNFMDIDEWPLSTDGFRYDDKTFVDDYAPPSCTTANQDTVCRTHECDTTVGFCKQGVQDHPADYNHIIDQFGLDAAVTNGTYDDVWIAAPSGQGFTETVMVGPKAIIVNATPISKPASVRNYVIEYVNTAIHQAFMEHAYVHRLEWFMRNVYFKFYQQDGLGFPSPSNWNTSPYQPNCLWGANATCTAQRRHFWDKFTLVDGVAQNLRAHGDPTAFAGVGAAHFMPNATDHDLDNYNYGEPWEPWTLHPLGPVTSSADDWVYNFPNLTGESRSLDRSEWPFGPDGDKYQSGFMLWLMNHVPHVAGRHTDGVLNNWWEYVVNFNDYPEALK